MAATETIPSIILIKIISVFFHAEDGIRDYKVAGVQTCALPICADGVGSAGERHGDRPHGSVRLEERLGAEWQHPVRDRLHGQRWQQWQRLHSEYSHRGGRSEERRVGKECRARRWRQTPTEHGST